MLHYLRVMLESKQDYSSKQHTTASVAHDHLHLIHVDVNKHYYLSHDLDSGCLAFVFCHCLFYVP